MLVGAQSYQSYQAEVVMVQLGAGRGAKANETLLAVQRRCHGL